MEYNGGARKLFLMSNFPIPTSALASPACPAGSDQYLADLLSNQDGMGNFFDPGQSSVAGTTDAYSEGPVFGVECQQSLQEHEQYEHGICRYLQSETDKASKNSGVVTHDMTNLAQPGRLEYSSSPNLSQFQYSISMPSPIGDFHALLDSGLFVSGGTSIQGPVDVVEELNQMTPERIRERSRKNNETNGCKRCNCKRSKCLKLYCECFSAGFYCADSCSCVLCLNKPEYEDTVMDIRKQIELRNPHAFAPKVFEQGNGSPANTMQEELNQTRPSSGRHKRGCNCKKSKCHKKYCECYQANVGCSEGCRCGNCENPFGTKAIAGVMNRRTINQENQSPEQLDVLKNLNKNTRIGSSNQSSPLSDINNLATISHPRLGSLALAPRATLHPEAGLYSAGHPNMQFTPKSDGSLPIENSPPIFRDSVYASPVLDHTLHKYKQ